MKDGWLPWTKSCFVCGEENPHGLRLRSRLEGGRVVIDYTTRRADVGYRHMVHGGIAATLLDEVMTWAAIVVMKKVCVAAELTTRLKAPIGVGQKVRVEGWVTRAGSRLCLTEGVVRDAAGREMLTAAGKYMPMPAKMAGLSEKDFVHSPDALNPLEIAGSG